MDFIVASAAKYSYALQEHTPMLATCHSPLSGSGPGPGSGSGTETVKRPSAVQDVNFAAKRDAQRAGGGEVSREGEREREAGESRGMSVVGWLVIDAGDKEALARVKFRAGSGPAPSPVPATDALGQSAIKCCQ